MLLITSCDKTETPAAPGAQNPAEDPDKAFFDAVAASKAREIKTLTYYTYTTESGEEKIFNGTYETSIKSNGDVVFSYTYQRAARFEDIGNPNVTLDGNIATVGPLTVYYSNGKYSYDMVEWFVEAPAEAVNQPKLNLSKETLGSYTINDAKTSVTATLSPEAAAKLLGMTVNAVSDVTVVVSTNGSYLTRLTISYETESARVKIDTSYS
jgi:hypothetical protein